MNSVTVFTNGCPENRNDCSRMEEYLKLNGYKINRDYRESSLILFNACGLTNSTEDESIKIIESIINKKNPHSRLIVWGCLSKINPVRLASVYHGPTFDSDDITRISEFIDLEKKQPDIQSNYMIPYMGGQNMGGQNFRIKYRSYLNQVLDPKAIIRKLVEPKYRLYSNKVNLYSKNSFIIKISTGCMSSCAYCAVKISRGKVKSKSIDVIKKEFTEGLSKGFTDFALVATDAGADGIDKGSTLTELLEELTKLPGNYQMRIRNIQPKFLIKMLPNLKRIFRRGKISYIGASAQSGSDKVLKAMKRGYRIDEYKHAISELKLAHPKLKIRTQLMVGFPGETEKDFEDTLKLLDEVKFDYVQKYIFEARLGTVAAACSDLIPGRIVRKRYNRLAFKVFCISDADFKAMLPKFQLKAISLLNTLYNINYSVKKI